MAQDGEIRQQDGDPENLRGDQRHDARFAPVSVCPSTCLRFFFTSLMSLCVRILLGLTCLPVRAFPAPLLSVYCFRVMVMMKGGGV